MTYQPTNIPTDRSTLPKTPAWVTTKAEESLTGVAFQSGAALAALDGLITHPSQTVPVKLLANRLALKAAAATSKLEGRLTREADIRDAFHLTPPGEARGPDGDLLAFWRKASRGLDAKSEMFGPFSDHAQPWLEAGLVCADAEGPLAGCTLVMRKVLSQDDRAERFACLLSDIVLARFLKWKVVLPVSALKMAKTHLRDLNAAQEGAELQNQKQLLAAIALTTRLTHDLTVRAARLRAIAPKLRSKGSDAAVNVLLTEDAVAPSTMLSPTISGTKIAMTDRAARRFCDRLVALGVAQELTGRTTFRLYGIGP